MPEELPAASPTGHESVLIVDDEKLLVTLASDMLSSLGYAVTGVAESTEALEIFRTHSNRFDLVITDQTMPGMTGMELSAELLRIRGDIPVILCTGYSDNKLREEAQAIGIREIISKPYIMRELGLAVREVLDQATAASR